MTKIKHVLKLVAVTVVAVLMAVVLDLDITACSNVADSGGGGGSGSGGGQGPTYIGTKAPTEAKAVGDIVFKDGSASPSTDTITPEQKAAAVAVIFHVVPGLNNTGSASRTLGVGIKQNTNIWCTTDANGYDKDTPALREGVFKDGSTGLEKLKDAWADAKISLTKYPTWAFCADYGKNNGLTSTPFETGWYLPTVEELQKIFNIKTKVNTSLEKVSGDKFLAQQYWSCSIHYEQGVNTMPRALVVKFENGQSAYGFMADSHSVCSVREF